VQMIAAAIEEDPAMLDAPDVVLAFKVEDTEAVATQLKRLEVFANLALQQADVDRQAEWEEIGESEFLVLKLDGSMIPWGEEAPEDMPLDEETYENLKEIISAKELAIAVGEWNGYVLVAVGASTEHLAKLGDGDLLRDNDKFAWITPHLDGNVVSVQYASEKLVAQQYATGEDLDAFAAMINESLEESEEVPAELKERISEDLPALAEDLKPFIPKPGAMVGCTLMTDRGFETYKYSWAQQPRLDATKPLEIISHVGGSPLVAVAARGESHPEDYETLAKWVGKAIGYFEDFALEQMDEDDREEAEQVLEIARPLLGRFDEATREHLVPALADGQSALVIDADITSKQWQAEMPESFHELPMLELGVVMGVSDAEEFKTALREYKSILNDLVDAIREADPESIPEGYEIPDPEKQETSDGAVYSWRFEEAELDEQLALCIGLSEDYAIFGTSPALAERVLAEKPIEHVSEELGGEPRAIVAGVHFAALIDAAAPWVHYAIRANAVQEDQLSQDPEDDPSQVGEIWSQVETGLDILKCFRGAWSETRQEEGVWVTHSVAVFEDLEGEDEE
ncbi:MAG TPA: hypothetical protein VF175_02855, partial [Lacipirellula sp.]